MAADLADPVPALLRREGGRGAEFGTDLANHLPMALVILGRLGAPEQRLRDFAAAYRAANPLRPAPPDGGRVGAANWREGLGRRELEGDYRGFFARAVAREGVAAVLRRCLPVLVPGIAASALHALMRLAYALERDDPAEVATALGYWCATFLPLRAAEGAAPLSDDPLALLPVLRERPGLRALTPPSDLLWHWMRAAAAHPDFPPVAALLAPAPDLTRRLAHAGLVLMAGTMSFEALHAVTGAHWLRLVGRRWPDPSLAGRYFWQAIAAVYPKLKMPALPDADALDALRATPAPAWPAIAAAALRSDDEHDISFAYSAREEAAAYGDPLYRVLAARRLGLLA